MELQRSDAPAFTLRDPHRYPARQPRATHRLGVRRSAGTRHGPMPSSGGLTFNLKKLLSLTFDRGPNYLQLRKPRKDPRRPGGLISRGSMACRLPHAGETRSRHIGRLVNAVDHRFTSSPVLWQTHTQFKVLVGRKF